MSYQQNSFIAGAAVADITPKTPIHLSGYPFVERTSIGVHDNLLSSALYLSDGKEEAIFIGNDVIFVDKKITHKARKRISETIGIDEKNILISATHTHSSPGTVAFVSSSHDSLLPPIDDGYLQLLEDGIVEAAIKAYHKKELAQLSFSIADATGIGTNRHNPNGASDLEVPVLLVHKEDDKSLLACMLVCNMHPTILHEDSKLVSGDFPGISRLMLQKDILKTDCPIIYHTGAAGNQSPRHVTKENTFAEAERIAKILCHSISLSLKNIVSINDISLKIAQSFVELPRRKLPDVANAAIYAKQCEQALQDAKTSGKTSQQIRSAEVNWFGAMESLNLAEMAANNQLEAAYKSCMPAEIQVFKIGQLSFVAWPGEVFVEYGLNIKEKSENTFVITLANGDLQVYIATKQAVEDGVYEASNAIFDHSGGDMLVKESFALLQKK